MSENAENGPDTQPVSAQNPITEIRSLGPRQPVWTSIGPRQPERQPEPAPQPDKKE